MYVFLPYWVSLFLISGVWCKIELFCAILLYVIFSIFFGYSNSPKKNPLYFFLSQNLKFRKAKMCIQYQSNSKIL